MRKPLPIQLHLYGIIAVMTLTAMVITLWVILPTTKKIYELKNTIRETEKFLETQYQRTKELRRSIIELPSAAEQTDVFAQSTVNSGDELVLITEFEELARRFHIDQSYTITKNDPSSVTFSFTNRGAFENHLAYLHGIERLPQYIFIDRLVWEKQQRPRQTGEQAVSFRFNATVYITPIAQ